jgi:outer membrane protein assembly factor BamB
MLASANQLGGTAMNSMSPVAEISALEVATTRRSSRRWPTLALVFLGIACCFLDYLWLAAPESIPAMPIFIATMWGSLLCALILGGWWLVRGADPWQTRLAAAGLAILIGAAAMLAADLSARSYILSRGIPTAVGLIAVLLCFTSSGLRHHWAAALCLAVLALVPWQLLQFNGTTGRFGMDPDWRWRPKADAQATLFDQNHQADSSASEQALVPGASDWPAFRGPRQDDIVPGIKLGDWETPPTELWRRPVGPGWSSVCVIGDRLFTQEQRGDEETVACYSASTRTLLWACGDTVRYSDMPSGVGPRGTPTFHDGKVYTFGATGILNCIDARTGKRLWGNDLKKSVGATAAPFGFASSPVAVGSQIIVHPGSPTGPRLVAYQAETGKLLWQAGSAAVGYSSPHLATLGGVPQVLVYNRDGLFGHDPSSGKELWAYEWKAELTAPVCVQPVLLPEDRVVLGAGTPGMKSRCVKPIRRGEEWSVEDVWEGGFYTGFNDCVRSGDFLYGLEGGRLFCVDAKTGKRRWKDGQYGAGQVLLAGDRLIVLAESGRLSLVNPTPDGWQELRKVPALSDKTWNHAVIANGRLFVRNAREMVCYELGR